MQFLRLQGNRMDNLVLHLMGREREGVMENTEIYMESPRACGCYSFKGSMFIDDDFVFEQFDVEVVYEMSKWGHLGNS